MTGDAVAPGGPSLQEQYLPDNVCFGFGHRNPAGLGLRSYAAADGRTAVASWQPGVAHQAFPGVLCGGIVGTMIDCPEQATGIAQWRRLRRSFGALHGGG